MKNFIQKTEQFLQRMHWKAYYFLNPTESSAKETYGFKSRNSPPRISELIPFEDSMLDLIQNIEFKDVKCNSQNQMNSDIKNKIKKPDSLLIPADKTTIYSYYTMNPASYNKLIKENVTKTYKKSSDSVAEKLDAETCELVGCYLLSLLTEKYGQNIGLYRADGLAAFDKMPQEIEKIKKELCKIFRKHDLKITIEAKKTIVNFLDVTLDLQSGKCCPFTKEDNVPLHVHKKSNHPPSIPKNILDSINRWLSEISSDQECFDNAKTVYQEALNKSGYNYNLSYKESHNETQRSRRNRPRNILWYNPPYGKNVKTNVGKCFLSLTDQHFPKSNPLHKIFDRNTLKLSYSCMSNIKNIISNHNKAQINKSDPTNDSNCNCWNSSTCPMDGKCNDQNIIYQAEVTTSTSRET